TAAVLGALLLSYFGGLAPVFAYTWDRRSFAVTPVKLVGAVLVFGFALIELSSRFEKLSFDTRFIPLGGLISGFFGCLSGHQGALRSAFLLRAGLAKEAFVSTGVLCAVVIDVSRLAVYGVTLFSKQFEAMQSQGIAGLVVAGSLAAFLGAFIGKR